jgi:hypothetical protein
MHWPEAHGLAGEVSANLTQLRKLPKLVEGGVEGLFHPLRRLKIILGDVRPDGLDVALGKGHYNVSFSLHVAPTIVA